MTDGTDIAGLLASGVLDGGSAEKTDASLVPVAYDHSGLGMIAFGIWAYEAGQDVGKVQEILQERTGMLVPLAQLRAWRQEGEWSKIFASVHQALSGITAHSSRAMLERAQLGAVATLIEVMNDKSANAGVRIKAAFGVLDRGGNPQMLRAESISAVHLTANSEYDDVSDEELEAEYTTFNADDYTDSREHKAAAMTSRYVTTATTT